MITLLSIHQFLNVKLKTDEQSLCLSAEIDTVEGNDKIDKEQGTK